MPKQLKYILTRFLYSIITIFVLVAVTFLLMYMLPGEPFVGEKALPPETMAAMRNKYALDKPVHEQFFTYVANVAKGDLGTSFVSRREVKDIIAKAFPISFELGLRALIFAIVIGVSLGVLAALKRGTLWDTLVMLLALIGVSVPSFIIGSLLQYFLGLVLFQQTGIRFFPIMGWAGESSKILPAFALAFSSIAVISRFMRQSMSDVLNQDYIKTAKAKGLKQKDVVLHHCLRNSIMPVITVMGPLCAVLFTGTFVIENIFSIPGLGKYFVDSVRAYDYPVIIGTTIFFGAFLVAANFVVDILHGVIDPRIRKGGGMNE